MRYLRDILVIVDRIQGNGTPLGSKAAAPPLLLASVTRLGGDTQNSKFYDSSRDPQRRHHALEGP